MKVSDLRPSEDNPRTIGEKELAGLKQALEAFGDLGGIVFNRKTGNLVGGHQRTKTLDPSWTIVREIVAPHLPPGDARVGTVAIGWIETPFGRLSYREVEWEPKIERAANLAANKWGGTWDDSKLKELLVSLDDGSGLLGLTGFSSVDLQGLIDRGAASSETPSEKEVLFEQLTFTLTKSQLSEIGFALDKATKAGPFEGTGNENARGNALHRIALAYVGGKA